MSAMPGCSIRGKYRHGDLMVQHMPDRSEISIHAHSWRRCTEEEARYIAPCQRRNITEHVASIGTPAVDHLRADADSEVQRLECFALVQLQNGGLA